MLVINRHWKLYFIFIFFNIILIDCELTYLENLRPIFRKTRIKILNIVGRSGTNQRDFQSNLQNNRLQRQFSKYDDFFCDVHGPGARSPRVPDSVHKLRPGDIDVVGSIGDSLSAGNGGMASNLLQVLIQNKGVTWNGGYKTWRQFFTLPNILKLYNPKLYGYSVADGYSFQRVASFNVAENFAMSRDIPHQARNLIRRITSDRNVDVKNDWKLITILIGANDFCWDMCFQQYPEDIVDRHEADLVQTLRALRDKLPRTFVNLIGSFTMRVLLNVQGKPQECETLNYLECPCIFGIANIPKRKRFLKIMDNWQKRQIEVINREEFQNRTDFTVVLQPYTDQFFIPRRPDGNTDYSFLSRDCFHFGQKLYAMASNALWNNMLEPVGNKTRYWLPDFAYVRCPTEERPYLATKFNS